MKIHKVENAEGVEIEIVEIQNGDSSTWMPKAVWDELEAQKELGGTL